MSGTQPTVTLSPRSKRTIVGGIAFIGAALTFLTGIFVTSPDLDKGARVLAAVAADPGRVQVSWTMDVLYMILMVPALLAVANLVRGRGASLTYLGAALALFGNLGHAFFLMFEFVALNMVAPGADRSQMAALIDRINSSPVLLVVMVMLIAYALGSLLLVIGLYRAHVLPLVSVILIIVTALLDVAQFEPVGYDAKVALGAIVLGWIGLALIQLPKGRSAATPSGQVDPASVQVVTSVA